MTASSLKVGAQVIVAAGDFQHLLDALAGRGYQVMGPTLEDGQLIYGEIGKVTDLPIGWTAIARRAGPFAWNHGRIRPSSASRWGSSRGSSFSCRRTRPCGRPKGRAVVSASSPRAARSPNSPSWGSGPVNLQAMAVQDRVFLKGAHVDPTYRARRESAFIVAVNCGHQDKGTCFCVSMGTGPRAATGFDLALTEVLQGEEHFFVVEIGTDRGAEIIRGVPQRRADKPED